MAKGIAWITTTYFGGLKDAMALLRPLEEEASLELRVESRGLHFEEDELIAGLPGVVATLPSNDAYTARVLAAAGDLKIIARTGVGLNSIDLEAATEKGIVVTHAAGQNADSVAEHTFGIMLGAARGISGMNQGVRAGEWASLRKPVASLKGATLGIIGLGNIGKRVARRAIAFGMEVVAHDIVRDERFAAETGVYFHSLEEVASRADFLTCHVPLTPETRGMIGPALLGRMKPTAFLINTSRGPVVNIDALDEFLSAERLRGAAIDVFPEEPPDTSHPLFSLPNVVVTPHTAGLSEDACENCVRHAVRAIVDCLAGRRPADVANPAVLEKAGIGE